MAEADALNGFLGGLQGGVGLYNALRLAPLQQAELKADIAQKNNTIPLTINGQTYNLPENLAAPVLGSQAYGTSLLQRMLLGDSYRNGEVDSNLQNKVAAVPTYQALMNAAITVYQAHQSQERAMQSGNPTLAQQIGSQLKQELGRNPLLEPYVAQAGGNMEVLFNKIRGQLGTEVSKVQTGSGQFVTDEEALKQFNNAFPEFNDPQQSASAAFNLAADTYLKGTYQAVIDRTASGQNPDGTFDNPELGNLHNSYLRQQQQILSGLVPFPGSEFSTRGGPMPSGNAPVSQPNGFPAAIPAGNPLIVGPSSAPNPLTPSAPRMPGLVNTAPGAMNLGAAAPLWGQIPGAPAAPSGAQAPSLGPLGPLPAAATGSAPQKSYQILSVQ